LSAANNIFIGKEQGSSGTLNMTGGTISTSDKLQVGHNQSTGLVIQSGGTVNVQNEVYIGNENNASSVGTYTLSGTGALNVGNEVIVGRDNGTGTLNLNGGTVTATKISGGNGSATVNFNGGVLKAKRDEVNFIENLDTANVESGGIKIDSNGFNVATSQAFSGAGGLEKSGSGSLTLSGASANTFTGVTTVSAGTLRLNKDTGVNAIAGNIAVTNSATLLLSSSGNVADTSAVTLSGGTITRGSNVSEVFGSLSVVTVASFLDYGAGNAVGTLTFDGAYTGSALLTVQNFLPGNKLQFATGFDDGLLPTGGDLSNENFAFSNGFTTGTEGGYFTITAIPEPSTYAAAAGLLSLLLWPSRRRIIRDTKKILSITPPMRGKLAAPAAKHS
jgi:autotransporter-associated beta strand protein